MLSTAGRSLLLAPTFQSANKTTSVNRPSFAKSTYFINTSAKLCNSGLGGWVGVAHVEVWPCKYRLLAGDLLLVSGVSINCLEFAVWEGAFCCCRDFCLALDPFSSATSLTRSFVILQGSFQTHRCGFELALKKRCCASEVPCPRALEHSTCNPNSQQTKPLNVKCPCMITWQKAAGECVQPSPTGIGFVWKPTLSRW